MNSKADHDSEIDDEVVPLPSEREIVSDQNDDCEILSGECSTVGRRRLSENDCEIVTEELPAKRPKLEAPPPAPVCFMDTFNNSPQIVDEEKNNGVVFNASGAENSYNPLKSIVLYIIDNKYRSFTNFDKLQNASFYSSIIDFIGFRESSMLNSVLLKIDIEIMKILLRRWEGWNFKDNDKSNEENISFLLADLLLYLTENFKYAHPLKHKYIRNEGYKYSLFIKDTYKNLKVFFHNEPRKYCNIFNTAFPDGKTPTRSTKYLTAKYIINHPGIKLKFMLPKCLIMRQNLNHNIFKLINLQKQYIESSINRQPLELYYQTFGEGKCIATVTIVEFLKQLTAFIKETKGLAESKKENLVYVISAILADMSLCGKIISTNTKYQQALSPYPYARYLGLPTNSKNGQPHITTNDQLQIGNSDVNLRLQQITYPFTSFRLIHFAVPFTKSAQDKPVFDLGVSYLTMLRSNCLSFECSVCNKTGSTLADMREHLMEFHGEEPDWSCTYCLQGFSTKFLSMNGWKHNCTSKLEKVDENNFTILD